MSLGWRGTYFFVQRAPSVYQTVCPEERLYFKSSIQSRHLFLVFQRQCIDKWRLFSGVHKSPYIKFSLSLSSVFLLPSTPNPHTLTPSPILFSKFSITSLLAQAHFRVGDWEESHGNPLLTLAILDPGKKNLTWTLHMTSLRLQRQVSTKVTNYKIEVECVWAIQTHLGSYFFRTL